VRMEYLPLTRHGRAAGSPRRRPGKTWRSGRGVDGGSGQPRERRRHNPQGFAKMTAVEVLGRVDELADGTDGSVDADMGPAFQSISRIPINTTLFNRRL
jgi:hypothetical protein